MSARQTIDAAAAVGIRIAIDGGDLVVEADGNIPAAIIADLKQHKAEILGLLRQLHHGPNPRL